MRRVVATLPEGLNEICLVRLGIQSKGWWGPAYARSVMKSIEASSQKAIQDRAGLLHTDMFLISFRHWGLIQYWESFDKLEAWSHSPPHSEWWRQVLERARTKQDIGIYHESYLVPSSKLESIYLDCEPTGLASFGRLGEATGTRTTSRDRLGLRTNKEG